MKLIEETNILIKSFGGEHFEGGATYIKKGSNPQKAVLLVHGFSACYASMEILAKDLANRNYFCLSMNLPSHHNKKDFSLGLCSKIINQNIRFLKDSKHFNKVYVVSHSVGASSSIFSMFGYDEELERELFKLNGDFGKLTKEIGNLTKTSATLENLKNILKLNSENSQINIIISLLIKKLIGIENLRADKYVFLSPPLDIKNALPKSYLFFIKNKNFSRAKFWFELILHNWSSSKVNGDRLVKDFDLYKEKTINWQFFQTKNYVAFLEYFLDMKEPIDLLDFLQFLENLPENEKTDEIKSLLKLFDQKIKVIPKFFTFGSMDVFLKIGSTKKVSYYKNTFKNLGTAKIIFKTFNNHQLTSNPFILFSMHVGTKPKVKNDIFKFLNDDL